MVRDEAFLYHSVLSAYINAGLLSPIALVQRAEEIYYAKKAPLNAVEGFIRQIIGWREYVRGIYWLKMPEYAERNFLDASRSLPWFYWSGETHMNCISEAVAHTRKYAYSHHIQRLMVTGNFALLAGIAPAEVCEWYLLVYADAYDWVELPNTLGMALFGDGGVMASKPYAASGKYINRMSDYCKTCKYDPEITTGDKACPFNALYWDFLDRNADKLSANHRLKFMYASWRKMAPQKRAEITAHAAKILQLLDKGAII